MKRLIGGAITIGLAGIVLAVVNVTEVEEFVNTYRTRIDIVRVGLLSAFTVGYLVVRWTSILPRKSQSGDDSSRVIEARLLAWLWLIELLLGQRLWQRFGEAFQT